MSGIVCSHMHDKKELRFELLNKRIDSNKVRIENLPSYFEEVCGEADVRPAFSSNWVEC